MLSQLVYSCRHGYPTHSYTYSTRHIFQVVMWMNRFDTSLRRTADRLSLDELDRKGELILQGIGLACEIRGLVSNVLNLHLRHATPISKYAIHIRPKHLPNLMHVYFQTNCHQHVQTASDSKKHRAVLLAPLPPRVGRRCPHIAAHCLCRHQDH